MAIGADFINDLILLKAQGYIVGNESVLEVGAQQLSRSFVTAGESLRRLFVAFGIQSGYMPEKVDETFKVHGSLEHLSEDAPYAQEFYRALGFNYESIDFGDQANSFPLDLNFDEVPAERRGRYSLVTNFGTTEHICNQLNAFRVIHDFTAPGGVIYHVVPMSGYLNHGLINYNPKFFWMLCRANGYKVVSMAVTPSRETYPMPQNILDFVAPYVSTASWRDEFRVEDVGLKVILQKLRDHPFVAPFDSTDEALENTPELKERYGMNSTFGERVQQKGASAYRRLRDKLSR